MTQVNFFQKVKKGKKREKEKKREIVKKGDELLLLKNVKLLKC